MSPSGSSGIQPVQQQISNEVGSLDPKYSISSSDYSSVLTIQDVEFSDAGNYTCVASIGDRIGPIRSTAILTVHGTCYVVLTQLCHSIYNGIVFVGIHVCSYWHSTAVQLLMHSNAIFCFSLSCSVSELIEYCRQLSVQ